MNTPKKLSLIRLWQIAAYLSISLIVCKQALAQATSTFVYEGRLANAGSPVAGPVALRIRFFHSNSVNSAPVLTVTKGLESVPLVEGVFQLRLEMAQGDYNDVFSGVGQPVWLDITDMTHAPTAPFPVQEISAVPYAARVPVDGSTLNFNSAGELSVGPSSAPAAGQFLTKDGSGNLVWATPAGNGAVLQGQAVSLSAPGSGQVLEYNGSQWVPMALSANGNIVTSLTASAPLAITGSSGSPTIAEAQATSISSGFLAASDWVNFSGKVAKSGDSMSGTLDMGSFQIRHLAPPAITTDAANKAYVDAILLQSLSASGSTPLTGNWAVGGRDITGIGNVGLSATKTLSLGTFDSSSEPTLVAGLSAGDKGKTWFNISTNQLRYWDGTNAQAVGAAGGGLTSLNGLTATSQLFAVTAAGSTLGWSSAGSTHTLDLPLAAVNGAAAGLLSNTDYTAFNNKVGAVSAGTGLTASTASGSVTIGLAATGTAGSYTKVTTNAQGQVTGGANLTAADIPALSVSALSSGTLPVSLGGTGLAASPGAGQLLIGNDASGYSLGNLVEGSTQSVTVAAGAGTITLDTAQDIRTSASPVFTGLEISGVTSSLLKTTSSGLVASAAASDVTTTLGYTPVNKAGDTLSGGLSLGGALTAHGMAAPALSAVGSGVLYFDTGSSQFKVSQNGFAYTPLITGGSVTSVSTGTGLTGGPITTSGTLSLATVGAAGTYAKVITDPYGRVTGSASLAAADIPPLPASALTSGTLSANVLPSLAGSYVALSGSTMNGSLVLPINGLAAGTNQFVLANGNVGVGSAVPAGKLDVAGTICFNGTNCISSWPGGGTTAVTSVSAGSGLTGGPITSTGSLSLASVGTAGSYVKVVTDSFGRVVAATSLLAADLPSISATTITAGTLAVANGGTGVNTLTNNGLLVGAGSMAVSTLSTSTQYSVLTATTGGVPTFGAVALNQSAAVTGLLPPANGGTGLAVLGTANQLVGVVGGGGALEYKTVAGTAGEISVNNTAGSLTLSTPQTIATTSSPSFVTVNLSGSLGLGSSLPNSILDISGALTERGLSSAPSASTSGQGVIYFDSGLHHFYVSENGGSYQQLSSGVVATTVTAGAGLQGGSFSTNGTISLPAVATAGTYAKVVTDAYGRVTGSASLAAADIPALSASAITSGSFTASVIPPLPASILTSGTLALATIPSLPATALTSGTLNIAQMPGHSAALITSGTLSTAVLPSLAGSYVAVTGATMTGILNLPENGLIAGTNQLVLANGNIGIGTSAPANLLTLQSSTQYSGFHLQNSTNTVVDLNGGGVSGDDGELALYNGGAKGVFLVASGNSYMTGGNIGIGTTTPIGALEVEMDTTAASGSTYAINAANKTAPTKQVHIGYDNTADVGVIQSDNYLVALKNLALNPSGGNVGIGSLSPSAALDVVGEAHFMDNTTAIPQDYEGLSIQFNRNIGYGETDFINDYTGAQIAYNFWQRTSSTSMSNLFQINSTGNASLTGSLSQNSDIRLKKDVNDLDYGLSDVLKLRGVSYYWRDTHRGTGLQVGLIAQEVEQVVPEVVQEGFNGIKSIAYANLVPVLIEAVKEEHQEKDAAVAALRSEKDREIADLRAAAAREKASAEQAQSELATVKAFLCGKFPDAPMCGK